MELLPLDLYIHFQLQLFRKEMIYTAPKGHSNANKGHNTALYNVVGSLTGTSESLIVKNFECEGVDSEGTVSKYSGIAFEFNL